MLLSKHDVSEQKSLYVNQIKTSDGTDILEGLT